MRARAPQMVEKTPKPERSPAPGKGGTVAPERLKLNEQEVAANIAKSREMFSHARELLKVRAKPDVDG